jgi:serine-type D-Ala-D-Ala endopeptidase (penicillin-binding protein 7)
LHVTRTRLFRNFRLICALLVTAVFGLHAELYAQAAATPKAPASRQASGTPSGSGTSARLQLPAKKAPAKATKKTSTSAARARRARLARTRAAAAARALKEAQEPRFKLDEHGALVPDIRAEAAIIYNPQTGQVLWESNSQDQRSIASITKVMTAAVFLENSPDLSREVVVQAADVRRASTTYLRAGYKITTDNLLHLLLIGSDNAAARVLARVSPHGSEGFIARMNDKALELGLTSTHYADPSGLLASNVSSAYDMARLIAYVSGDQRISEIMRTASYSVAVGRRSITVNSTNQLVRQGDVDVVGGKTGFISRAGYCLATLLRLPQGGPQVAVVVLGAKSNAGRFWETRHLFNCRSTTATALSGGIPVEAAADAI